MALTIEFSRRSTNQLQKILTFYDERNDSDNYVITGSVPLIFHKLRPSPSKRNRGNGD